MEEEIVVKKRKQLKPLSLEIGLELHSEIRLRAAKARISLKEWMLRAIAAEMSRENQYE